MGDHHLGFRKSALKWDEANRTALLQMLDAHDPPYRIVLTGHSLGAAIAQQLAYLWRDQAFFANGHCYGFCPPAGFGFEVTGYSYGLPLAS